VYYELLKLGEKTERCGKNILILKYIGRHPKSIWEKKRERERHRRLEKLLCLPIEVTGSENHEL